MSKIRLVLFVFLGTFVVGQGTKLPGPLIVTPAPTNPYQSSIVLVDMGLPTPPCVAGTYTISIAGGQLQECDGAGAYHTLQGKDGLNGTSATVALGTVSTLPPGSPASVTNSGDNLNAIFNFGLPAGKDGTNGISPTVGIGTVTSGLTPAVTNSGTPAAATFNFVLQPGPKGDPGVDSFAIGSSMTVVVTSCNIIGVGRTCTLKRVK